MKLVRAMLSVVVLLSASLFVVFRPFRGDEPQYSNPDYGFWNMPAETWVWDEEDEMWLPMYIISGGVCPLE